MGCRRGDFRAGKVLQIHLVEALVLMRVQPGLREGKRLAQGHTAKWLAGQGPERSLLLPGQGTSLPGTVTL